MKFNIDFAEPLQVQDQELSDLLIQVYVDGGYTSVQEAETLFEAQAVRSRGHLIAARDPSTSTLCGIIILVPAGTPAIKLAKENQAEIHLLAVAPDYRRHGLGRQLVEAAIIHAEQNQFSKIILWTQTSMKAAQILYESLGFVRTGEMSRNQRQFKIYERSLK